jgi:chromosome segregation ATPase
MSKSDASVVAVRSFRHVALLCATTLLLSGVTGCTVQEQKSGAAKTAFRNFQKSLDKMDARVDSSVRALDRLASTKTFDRDDAYHEFVTEYFNVSADAAGVRENADFMREAGVDYFVTTERLAQKEGAEKDAAAIKARADAARPQWDQVQQSLTAARDVYKSYQGELAALSKQFAKGHTGEQVAAAGPQINSAKSRAADLKAAIKKVQDDTKAFEHQLEKSK